MRGCHDFNHPVLDDQKICALCLCTEISERCDVCNSPKITLDDMSVCQYCEMNKNVEGAISYE